MAHSTKKLQSPGTKSLVRGRTTKMINLNNLSKWKTEMNIIKLGKF